MIKPDLNPGERSPLPYKLWLSTKPTECQICHRPIDAEFVDGRVRGISSWAIDVTLSME